MLNLIYAAEVQYRHDTERMDRELLRIADMAERTSMTAPTSRHLTTAPRTTTRAAWPRPISEHGMHATPALAAC